MRMLVILALGLVACGTGVSTEEESGTPTPELSCTERAKRIETAQDPQAATQAIDNWYSACGHESTPSAQSRNPTVCPMDSADCGVLRYACGNGSDGACALISVCGC